MTELLPNSAPERGIFCNRTLNLRSIKAVGYDMDYTLIHYRVAEWEQRAYEALKARLVASGWPIGHLEFEPERVCRGLIIDTLRGNLVKANRFGFVKKAMHGTKVLNFEEQRNEYSRVIVELNESRWVFLNTLFSLSEGCMYAQLIDLLDERKLPEVLGYADLYRRVRNTLDAAHMEGKLKAEIIAHPERFVVLDEETPLALLDQKNAGKKLLLITNSEWGYTVPMMSYAFDRFLPDGMSWRELFDYIIVGARKPEFFTTNSPFFEVVTEDGLLATTAGVIEEGKVYLGGSAAQLERHLKLTGDEILYVGDHMFGDVKVTKSVLRWRTALILRELEDEILAARAFHDDEKRMEELMARKEHIEAQNCQLRLALQRLKADYGPRPTQSEAELLKAQGQLKEQLEKLDREIGPLAKTSSELSNPIWGPLMRAGNDKSHLARQMERYADIYTSRVSNLLDATPFVYLRSPRGDLPHDPRPLIQT